MNRNIANIIIKTNRSWVDVRYMSAVSLVSISLHLTANNQLSFSSMSSNRKYVEMIFSNERH